MARKPKQAGSNNRVETLTHDSDQRINNPTAEMEELVPPTETNSVSLDWPRRNNPDDNPELYNRDEDLDPQLVWLGKDEEDREPLNVDALPIYVQEHIQPKALIEDIRRRARQDRPAADADMPDLFAEWAEELSLEDRVEFYAHQQKWRNRMILGDSLQVMTSLAEKEGLKGAVQSIYMDPPYGIKFSSNWQTSTKSRSVGENDLSREPEAIKAFRDTWTHGIHSYLSYLRDRLTVARDLLTPSGSIFVQISEQNLHLVRVLLDEVFGKENFVSQIYFATSGGFPSKTLSRLGDYVLWFAKDKENLKSHQLYQEKRSANIDSSAYKHIELESGKRRNITAQERRTGTIPSGKILTFGDLCGQGPPGEPTPFEFQGRVFEPSKNNHWKPNYPDGLNRLARSNRIEISGNTPRYVRYFDDFPLGPLNNAWLDTSKSGSATDKLYVVQTSDKIIQRCLLMTTDPGDLVLDSTCGSGTTAVVAEQWGRRWITTDTSRISLALARARLMGAHFDWYLLKDSPEGAKKELETSGRDIGKDHYGHNVRNGFVLDRVPHITLGGIANNSEIDEIWQSWQEQLEPLRAQMNSASGNDFEEWEIPHEADPGWPAAAIGAHDKWWQARIGRQQEIDASIARNAETEYLHDRPFKQAGTVRVTGPFTVESLSPHRILPTDAEDDALIDALTGTDGSRGEAAKPASRLRPKSESAGETGFHDIIFENLRKAGVQNTKKGEKLEFTSLEVWPNGHLIQFEGRWLENGKESKAAVCIGPEYGTVSRSLMVKAAREAADYFDLLIVLGFAFEAYADDELLHIGSQRVMRARLNSDLHMADKLKAGKSGNLFVVFGEPDIELRQREDGQLEAEILGVDIFDPTTGEVKSSGPDDIACWFIDTNYNEEAFFVRHAYFSGGGQDPYKKLKNTLKADIDPAAWDALYDTVSRPFARPDTGRIAVKAINHYGDEVLRVFVLE